MHVISYTFISPLIKVPEYEVIVSTEIETKTYVLCIKRFNPLIKLPRTLNYSHAPSMQHCNH